MAGSSARPFSVSRTPPLPHREAEFVLYGFDKVTDAGLGEAKLVSGGGKAPGLYDFQKDFKFFYIHT